MTISLKPLICLLTPILMWACGPSESEVHTNSNADTSNAKNHNKGKQTIAPEYKQRPEDFIPKEFVLFEKIIGDLNKDGIEDCVLIIKGTDKSKVIHDEIRGPLDRNRRGMMVFLNKNGIYETVVNNPVCFTSENEDGGFYYPPELSVEIINGKLYVHFLHGKYGYWKYTFRHLQGDFELIGYDESNNHGPIIDNETSINFLSKKRYVKVNTNPITKESGDEVFTETWTNIKVDRLIKLSEIHDFNQIELSAFFKP